MAHFLGEVSGSRGKASRLGTKKSGLKTTAASWAGAITVDLDFNELTGKSTFSVWQREWIGKGINGTEPLAEGIIGEPVKKENGKAELIEALELAQATIERVNPKVHNSCGGTLDVIRTAIAKAKE